MPTNKEIIQGAYEAFAAADVPKVLGLMDDTIKWTDAEGFPLYSGTLVGPQQVVDGVFMRLGEIGDDFSVHPTRFVAEDDTVVALGTYTWKQHSTGAPAEVQMAHVWTLRDGKIISFEQHVDTLKVQERVS
jgi:ketosteroid isomerase-like protein